LGSLSFVNTLLIGRSVRTGLALLLLVAALRDPTNAFWRQRAPDVFRVEIATTKGKFVLEIQRDLAPIGADRFYNLVRAGFYDDSRFYRVMAGRFAQFGIAGDPEIAAVWRSQAIPDDPRRESNTRDHRLRHDRAQHPHYTALYQPEGQFRAGRAGLRAARQSG